MSAGHTAAALTLAPLALQLQLNVVRYAMVDMLKRPPPGFEDVVTGHFRLMRHRQGSSSCCVVRTYFNSSCRDLEHDVARRAVG